jgi:hypothetical protein
MVQARFLLISALFLVAACGQPDATSTSQPLPSGMAATQWADVVYEISLGDVGEARGSVCFDREGGDGRSYRQCRLPFGADGVLRFSIGADPWRYGNGCQTDYTDTTLAAFDVSERGGGEIPVVTAMRPDGQCEFQAAWSVPRGSWTLCQFIGGCY